MFFTPNSRFLSDDLSVVVLSGCLWAGGVYAGVALADDSPDSADEEAPSVPESHPNEYSYVRETRPSGHAQDGLTASRGQPSGQVLRTWPTLSRSVSRLITTHSRMKSDILKRERLPSFRKMSDFDQGMRALSDGSRRRILIALRDEEPLQPFSGDRNEGDRAIQLHHVHLPLLEESDLVAWNQDTGTVRRGDEFEAVKPILAALEARRDALPDDYLPESGQIC